MLHALAASATIGAEVGNVEAVLISIAPAMTAETAVLSLL
jgi:hypothetical protein